MRDPSSTGGDSVGSAAGEFPDFWPVIPAGGAGTRLWPLSRAGRPKFLQDLTNSGSSLLQATAARLAPLAGERLLVVTGQVHTHAVREQLPQLGDHLLAEPLPRDSMPAIGWAAAVVERQDPDAVIGSFAADHVVGQEDDFRAAVGEAIRVARTGKVATLGIAPTFPSTGFGYVRLGEPLSVAGAPHAYAVSRFVEKPDAVTAERYLASGDYRWNAGMFVVRAGVLLDLLARYQPRLAEGLRAIAADPACLGEVWPGLAKVSIDHAVAEPAADEGLVAVVETSFPWDDIGDFNSLAGLLPHPAGELPEGLRVLGHPEQVIAHDASGIVVTSGRRMVAVVGVEDVVVVDTPDAVLVTTRERAQEVKSLVDELKATGHAEVT